MSAAELGVATSWSSSSRFTCTYSNHSQILLAVARAVSHMPHAFHSYKGTAAALGGDLRRSTTMSTTALRGIGQCHFPTQSARRFATDQDELYSIRWKNAGVRGWHSQHEGIYVPSDLRGRGRARRCIRLGDAFRGVCSDSSRRKLRRQEPLFR